MRPIIFVSMNVAPVGGVGADLLKCVRALCQQGRTVHVVYAFRDPRTLETIRNDKVRWHHMRIIKRPPVFAQFLIWVIAERIIRRIKKSVPDALVVCFERLPIGDVQVGTAPNALWMEARRKMGLSPWSKLPYRLWCEAMDRMIQQLRRSHIIVFSSRDKQALLDRGVPEERICKVIIPTDTKRFQPAIRSTERPYVTIIGADPKLKGIDIALQAWFKIAQRHPGIKLRIVTHGWKVRQLVPKDSPFVELADFKPEVEDYYHSSRLVLMPSIFETWGNVVLESLACGVPVIATSDVPASEVITSPLLGEVVRRDGLHDADILADAISRVISKNIRKEDMLFRHNHVEKFIRSNPDIVSWIANFTRN